MAKDYLSGKLAVILHADVAGSTALVQQDEQVAHERIQETFRRFGDAITKYHGRVRELRGDALLAEFERASDAVTAALAFQAEQIDYNTQLNDSIQPTVRVGIAMGEVVIADNTITGTGVILAQRLEQLASPGGVVLQGACQETIPSRFPFEYESLREQKVKGFDKSVRAYVVALRDGATIPSPKPQVAAVQVALDIPTRRWLPISIIILFIIVVGGLTWLQPWVQREEPALVERMAFSLPDKPSIAVLPFVNMSDDAQQEYFVDGMTEDLITDLSKLSGLFVIARNSSFTYKGKAMKVGQVAEELGVRYVLEGSVRRADDQVRINAQLIDAISGGHVWAERYDVAFSDVFAVQDKVTRDIVNALAIHLTIDEEARRGISQLIDPQAYDAFLRGWAHYRGGTPEDLTRAVYYFDRAIELDPSYNRAYAALAAVYWTVVDRDRSSGSTIWSRTLEINTDESRRREQFNLGMALKNPTPLAYQVAAGRFSRQGQHQEAVERARRAVALGSGDPVAHEAMAIALIYAGKPAEAETEIGLAMRLDPLFSHRYLYWLGLAQFGMGRFEEAADNLSRAAAGNLDDDSSLIVLAAAYGHLGRVKEAKSAIGRANALREDMHIRLADPELQAGIDMLISGPYTLKDVDLWPFQDRGDSDRLRAGLRLAGVPKTGESAQTSPQELAGTITVDATAAKALFDRGVLFVDVRGEDSWKDGHIPKAVHLALKTDFTKVKLYTVAEIDQEVVIYCMGPRCLLSSRACAKAVVWGFQKIYYFRDGYPGWKAMGYPIELQN